MKSIKERGASYERKLAQELWDRGFAVVRAGSSGGGLRKRYAPDIVALKKGVVLAIEVKKTSSLPLYVRSEQIEKLLEFAERAGALPLIAVKLPGREWLFVDARKLVKVGATYRLDENILRDAITLKSIDVLTGKQMRLS